MRISIWPGVQLTVWEPQQTDAVQVRLPYAQPLQPIRRVLSKRGWMLLLVRYDWRDRRYVSEETAMAAAGDTVENGAWHTVWLEGKWRWITSRMTTEQREYAADCVDAYDRFLADEDGDLDRAQLSELRWWREAGR